MKKLLFVLLFLTSTSTFSWYGPEYGPGFGYGGYGWGGYPPGAYGAMGYGWGIQAPSFNYQTIVSSPPIIVNNTQPPQVIYRENPRTAAENERLRSYFGK